jgi:hypothetical protein
VMGGVANISATIAEPGVIRQTGTVMRMVFGELDGTKSARGEAFANLCTKAGIDGVLSTQIQTELWMKFILLASNASLMALARLPVGKLRDDPDIAPWFTVAYEEVVAVGRAAGVTLPADAVEKTLNFNRNAPPHLMPSMGVDLLRGNRIELPWLSGKVVELGKKHGVATPAHALLYAMLKPYTMGHRHKHDRAARPRVAGCSDRSGFVQPGARRAAGAGGHGQPSVGGHEQEREGVLRQGRGSRQPVSPVSAGGRLAVPRRQDCRYGPHRTRWTGAGGRGASKQRLRPDRCRGDERDLARFAPATAAAGI